MKEQGLSVRYEKRAVKALSSMNKAMQTRILKAICGLTQEPPKGDIKPMQGKAFGLFRLRVGDYRIIYDISENEIRVLTIHDIESRGDVYKKWR